MDLINKYFGDDKSIYELYESEKREDRTSLLEKLSIQQILIDNQVFLLLRSFTKDSRPYTNVGSAKSNRILKIGTHSH